jgi:hypothetical protein
LFFVFGAAAAIGAIWLFWLRGDAVPYSVKGRLTFADGRPAANTPLIVRERAGNAFDTYWTHRQVKVGVDGYFDLTTSKDRFVCVMALLEGYYPAIQDRSGDLILKKITVLAGQETAIRRGRIGINSQGKIEGFDIQRGLTVPPEMADFIPIIARNGAEIEIRKLRCRGGGGVHLIQLKANVDGGLGADVAFSSIESFDRTAAMGSEIGLDNPAVLVIRSKDQKVVAKMKTLYETSLRDGSCWLEFEFAVGDSLGNLATRFSGQEFLERHNIRMISK